MKQKKIIHVELIKPFNNKIHYYFSSIKAIYDILPEEIVGIKCYSLWNVLRKNSIHTTKTAIIRFDTEFSHPTNRGNNIQMND